MLVPPEGRPKGASSSKAAESSSPLSTASAAAAAGPSSSTGGGPVRPSRENPVFMPFSDTTPRGSHKTSRSSSREPLVSLDSLGTPTPTPPSPLGDGAGTASEGGGGDYEEVSSFDIMCALIKARHWLADNVAEAWIMEDDKSIIATSLTALVHEAARSRVVNWPVEEGVPTVQVAAKAAAESHRDQDAEMGDATIRLPRASISRPTWVPNSVRPQGACPLPTPPARGPKRLLDLLPLARH